MTFKILLFGKTGQVASAIEALQSPSLEVNALARTDADFEDPEACAERVRALACNAIVIAAAYTAVDRAEGDEKTAQTLNATTPGAIARAAAMRGVPVIHLSSDYVFDGTAGAPYCEDDAPGPINAYGRTKLAGEQALLASGAHGAIIRTSWVFATRGHNFLRTMLRLAGTREAVSVVDDQVGAPTPASAIAEAAVTLAQGLANGARPMEIYHFQGAPAASWADFAEAIFSAWAARGRRRPDLTRIATAQYPTPARRPLRTVLDCSRIQRVFGISQPDWRAYIGEAIAQWEGEQHAA